LTKSVQRSKIYTSEIFEEAYIQIENY